MSKDLEKVRTLAALGKGLEWREQPVQRHRGRRWQMPSRKRSEAGGLWRVRAGLAGDEVRKVWGEERVMLGLIGHRNDLSFYSK